MDEFDISESGTHVALVEYSTKASVQLKFNDFSKAELNAVNVKRKIQSLPHTRGFTYIDKALALTDAEIFSEKNGMRKNVAKVNFFPFAYEPAFENKSCPLADYNLADKVSHPTSTRDFGSLL